MAKIKSKGVSVLQSISSVYTAIAQVKSIDITGKKSETYDGRTLDQANAWVPQDSNGYVVAPTLKLEVWADPALASFIAFDELVDTPVPTNFKVTYTDSEPTSVVYAGTGFGIDVKATPAEGVSGTMEIVTSSATTSTP